jgi:fatty acid desaturase 2 (delta-6 desaturase)
VYDISNFHHRHPGGARIISHFAGQDATDAWVAMHKDRNLVLKYMRNLQIGKVQRQENDTEMLVLTEFRELRKFVENNELLKPKPLFFILQFAHIITLEMIAYFILRWYGVGWLSYCIAALILTTAQAQSGWSQHDYGHLSVFPTSWLNHVMHRIVIGHLKGASSHWWNFRHNQHHCKPNIIGKDPDIGAAYLFVVGNRMPIQWALRRKGFMPYDWQHIYFWFLGPPTLLTIYFHLENAYFMAKRRDFVDIFWTLTFFSRLFYCYSPILGGWGTFWFYMLIRLIEGHWFVLVTQMNHIPMEIDKDKNLDFVTAQAVSTCNIEPSWFNNWFTGHLNFQIEHHLFPTMPRHNYARVAPLVKSLFKKHGLPYIEKSLLNGVLDIVRSLEFSGRIWRKTYESVNRLSEAKCDIGR